jgi:hypothetical protein
MNLIYKHIDIETIRMINDLYKNNIEQLEYNTLIRRRRKIKRPMTTYDDHDT